MWFVSRLSVAENTTASSLKLRRDKKIIGDELPPSTYKYAQKWSNSKTNEMGTICTIKDIFKRKETRNAPWPSQYFGIESQTALTVFGYSRKVSLWDYI